MRSQKAGPQRATPGTIATSTSQTADLDELRARLTPQQQLFAIALAKGANQLDAYKAAGYKAKGDSQAIASACQIAKRISVSSYVDALKRRAEEEAVLSIVEKRRFLADVVRTPPDNIDGSSPLCNGVKRTKEGTVYELPNKLDAIRLDNSLAGHDAPKEVHVGLTLETILRELPQSTGLAGDGATIDI